MKFFKYVISFVLVISIIVIIGGTMLISRQFVNISGANSDNECEKLGYDMGVFKDSLLRCYSENKSDLFYDSDKRFLVTSWKKEDGE